LNEVTDLCGNTIFIELCVFVCAAYRSIRQLGR